MRKPDQNKIKEALKDVKNGLAVQNLRKFGYTEPQIREVEKIIEKELIEEIEFNSDMRNWIESL